MKVLNLGHPEQMLLALLRAALHQREVEIVYFQQATEQDWLKCYRFAVYQGVSALAWEGVERLPAKYAPPLNVKLSWALREKELQEEYRRQCIAANALCQLLSQYGIATIVLKGVGLSRFYPVPAHREGGDIDIYTYSADKTRLTNEEANRLADEILLKQGAIMDDVFLKKHSKFGFNGVTFENHRMFLHVAECKMMAKMEQWLKQHISITELDLLEGECRIAVPTIAFDSVFIPLHAAQHYGSGLSLKHLCDWALLVQQNGLNLPSELNDKYFKLIVNTLTQLCNQYLGLTVSVDKESDLVNEMMQEIFYPPYFGKTPSGGACKAYLFQLQDRIHNFKLKHRLLGVSFWGKIRGLVVRKIKECVTL